MSEYINPKTVHAEKHQAVTDIIESIALGEKSFADILSLEAKKLEAVLNLPSLHAKDLKAVNESVTACIKDVLKLQMLMEFKLDEIRKLAGNNGG